MELQMPLRDESQFIAKRYDIELWHWKQNNFVTKNCLSLFWDDPKHKIGPWMPVFELRVKQSGGAIEEAGDRMNIKE